MRLVSAFAVMLHPKMEQRFDDRQFDVFLIGQWGEMLECLADAWAQHY